MAWQPSPGGSVPCKYCGGQQKYGSFGFVPHTCRNREADARRYLDERYQEASDARAQRAWEDGKGA